MIASPTISIISRFGRDAVEVLEALHQLKALNIRVTFEQESFDTADTDSDLMIFIIESIAQAENESRSANIKWGSSNWQLKAHPSYITENAMVIKMIVIEV